MDGGMFPGTYKGKGKRAKIAEGKRVLCYGSSTFDFTITVSEKDRR